MNIAHDHKACQTGDASERVGGRTRDGEADTPAELQLPIDWQALRSRLFAAGELRSALGAGTLVEGLALRLRGSFDGCAASVLNTYQETSRAVNPDASGYGKSEGGKDFPVAGTSNGERGAP